MDTFSPVTFSLQNQKLHNACFSPIVSIYKFIEESKQTKLVALKYT